MKKLSSVVLGSLVVGMLAFGSAPLLAGEHGGSAMSEGSHGMEMSDEATTLMQAAKELKATNPKLSAKLEKLAKQHEM
jgi:hypothetical protein